MQEAVENSVSFLTSKKIDELRTFEGPGPCPTDPQNCTANRVSCIAHMGNALNIGSSAVGIDGSCAHAVSSV
jgi:hypothetical protein